MQFDNNDSKPPSRWEFYIFGIVALFLGLLMLITMSRDRQDEIEDLKGRVTSTEKRLDALEQDTTVVNITLHNEIKLKNK